MGKSYIFLQISFHLLLMTILFWHGHCKARESNNIGCKQAEREALVKFKNSFTSDTLGRLSSWVGEDCCLWRGVSCDNITGYVVKLILRGEDIPLPFIGPYRVVLPIGSCYNYDLVSPQVDSTLGLLKHLTHLDLSRIDFQGSQIPEFIGSMRQLRYLILSETGLSGYIPPQLGNLTNLRVLNLSPGCGYTINDDSLKWASGLLKLQSLELSGLYLAKPNDLLQVLNRIPLSNLELSNSYTNQLSFTFINGSSKILSTLQHLDLSGNGIGGSLPHSLGNLSSLRYLDLSSNLLNGSVPLWLTKLKALQHLDLGGNGFSHVEGGIWSIIGNPCNFKFLDMSTNQLSGEVLEPPINFSRCATFDFEFLDLSSNQISGSLPSLLGELGKLSYLNFTSNKLQGKIPASLGRLSALKLLDLSDNLLKGVITDLLVKLTQLKHLDISSNSLQGIVSLGNLSKLSYFNTSSNNLTLKFISGDWLPPSQLITFSSRSCKINAPFPQWFKNHISIQNLDLSNTGITGELPGWLWNMSYLSDLNLSSNHISGPFTSFFTSLKNLDLSHNDLTGSLPEETVDIHHNNTLPGGIPNSFGNLTPPYLLDLSSNHFSGPIPPSLSNIFLIKLNNNNLDGSIPLSFFTSNYIVLIDLSHNKLSGKIPTWHGESSQSLEFLMLRGNNLSGTIPNKLCSINLQMVDLASNNLDGSIPPCFGNSFSVHRDPFTNPRVEVEEVIKGQIMVYAKTLGLVASVDLSSNHLGGNIPDALMNLPGFISLNLSNNQLTGAIPSMVIRNMTSLESMDLSNNHLSGTIPQSLSALTSLSSLNMSYNNLHGQIPTSTQLQSFDPSAYIGNPGLWGCPLPIKCKWFHHPPAPASMVPAEDDEKQGKHEEMWFYLVIMLGVATGFWGVVGTLVFKKRWRHAFSRLVDEIMDWMYVKLMVRVNRLKKRSEAENSG